MFNIHPCNEFVLRENYYIAAVWIFKSKAPSFGIENMPLWHACDVGLLCTADLNKLQHRIIYRDCTGRWWVGLRWVETPASKYRPSLAPTSMPPCLQSITYIVVITIYFENVMSARGTWCNDDGHDDEPNTTTWRYADDENEHVKLKAYILC